MASLDIAFTEWKNRPTDERFWNVDDAFTTANIYKLCAKEIPIDNFKIVTAPREGLGINLSTFPKVEFSNYSFSQLASRIRYPKEYLVGLPAILAADVINYKLSQESVKTKGIGLIRLSGDGQKPPKLQALLSDKYSRIWNSDILERCKILKHSFNWKTPPCRPNSADPMLEVRAATEQDILASSSKNSLAIKLGDTIAPGGVYLSDHDCFVFMVNEATPIMDGENPLYRGVIVYNSEVGLGSFKLITFLYNSVCGNHIIDLASEFEMIRIAHLGNTVNERWSVAMHELAKWMDTSAVRHEALIKKARVTKLECLEKCDDEAKYPKVLGDYLKISQRDVIEMRPYIIAENERQDIEPNTVWSVVQGLTSYSQTKTYADAKSKYDMVAGKLLATVN